MRLSNSRSSRRPELALSADPGTFCRDRMHLSQHTDSVFYPASEPLANILSEIPKKNSATSLSAAKRPKRAKTGQNGPKRAKTGQKAAKTPIFRAAGHPSRAKTLPIIQRKWRRSDSNRRHLACKASALPTELRPRTDLRFTIYDLRLLRPECELVARANRKSSIVNPNWAWLESNQRPHPYQGCALTS